MNRHTHTRGTTTVMIIIKLIKSGEAHMYNIKDRKNIFKMNKEVGMLLPKKS